MVKKNIKKNGQNEIRKNALSYIKREQLINFGLFFVLIFLLFITFSLIYLNTTKIDEKTPEIIKKAYEFNNKFFKKEQLPAAIVNGDRIELSEVEKKFNSLPDYYKQLLTKKDILQQMIDEKLLLQEALKKGLNATDEEVKSLINQFLLDNGITEEEFNNALKQRNLSQTDVYDFYYKQIIFEKLLNESVLSKINITNENIETYYNENQELFIIPESRNVSHLLVCHNESLRCISNLSKEEALSKINLIKNEINYSNFGEKVAEYSYEPNANLTKGNLGWITKEDAIDETFLNATFNLDIGNISEVIETMFGYHLIIVFDKKPEEKINLSVVKDQINNTLIIEEGKKLYEIYLSELRNNSIINIYEIK